MHELTLADKNRIAKQLDQAALELAEEQLDAARRIGAAIGTGPTTPKNAQVLLFDAGRFDGEVQERWEEGEPPADLYLARGSSERPGRTAVIEADAGAFPADLVVWRYQLIVSAHYDLDHDGLRWRIIAGFYRHAGEL